VTTWKPINKSGRRRGLQLLAITVLWTDWRHVDSGRRDADTHRHAVWQQGSLIAMQDNRCWVRSSFRKTLTESHVANGFLFMINDDHVSILHLYRDMRPHRYWSQKLDLRRSQNIIGHVTTRSAYPKYLILESDPKWIRCSVAEIYSSENAEMWTDAGRGRCQKHLPENKGLLWLTRRKPIQYIE